MKSAGSAPVVLNVDGRPIEIPSFRIVREIGAGANGTVYEARDTLLDRSVALKIWNKRGRSRARAETAKIAALNHPLVVTTHSFGTADGHPYAVMELVPGISGKEWIKKDRSLDARVAIWRMYVRALRHLHAVEIVHGDPHLGNLIVFNDEAEAFVARNWRGEPAIAMKLADTGTSEFWTDTNAFAARESKLILETAGRMFEAERFTALAPNLAGFSYEEMLAACDAVVDCISTLGGHGDSYAYSMVASAVVRKIMETPVFDLDELYRQAFDSETTQVRRVITRINGALHGYEKANWHKGGEKITRVTRRLYDVWRNEWRAGKRFSPKPR